MTNPALKDRKEVITDLKDAGFDARQSRGIVQAVVDTTASLDLATRADLDQAVATLDKKIDDFKASVDRWHRAIFWGLVIGFTVLSFVLR